MKKKKRPEPRQRYRTVKGVANSEKASQPSKALRLPPEPTEQERALRDEQQVARTEQLMLQGVFTPRELMPMLGITDRRQMERYIARVRAAWQIRGAQSNIQEERGRAIGELERLSKELWEVYEQAPTVREKRATLESLARLREKKNAMMGITPELAIRIASEPPVPTEVLQSMRKQENLVEVLRQFARIIKEKQEKRNLEGGWKSEDGDEDPPSGNLFLDTQFAPEKGLIQCK